MPQYTRGELKNEGKTKQVFASQEDPAVGLLGSKDDLTAGDGKRHDIYQGFGRLSNLTTCNVFRLLQACGIPLAFREQVDDVTFAADFCEMILLEVVIRREAHGSYLKRWPNLKKGHYFPRLLFELFLKTSGRTWNGFGIPCDDPFMDYTSEPGRLKLYLPDRPLWTQEPFLVIDPKEHLSQLELLPRIEEITRKVALIIEKALQMQGIRLADFKIEFGITADGRLVVADVIDSSSWRIVGPDGKYIDKQAYREGGDVPAVFKLFERGLEITSHFGVPPKQQIVIWSGSKDDDLTAFDRSLQKKPLGIHFERVALSAHKQPVLAVDKLQRMVQAVPDTVVVAFIGRSNGAGPTLSAAVTVPVLTVPATLNELPQDVWSSLRTPSDVPVATILDPGNALLQAAQILAMRNPGLYAELRYRQEARLTNFQIIE